MSISNAPELKKRAVAYTRISTQGGGLIESLLAQISYYSEMIQETSGWEYAGVYTDDVSGAKGIREEFERMLSVARDGKFDILLTDSISRFTQSKMALIDTIRELTELGIEIYFDEQGISTMSKDGKLLLPVLESYLQAETYKHSERTKGRFRQDFAEGKTRFVPIFGFDFINHSLVPNRCQSAVVRRVFNEYIDGVSPSVIAERLNDEGVLKDHGGLWNSSMIVKLLTNERYTGHSLLQKYYTVDPVTGEVAVNRGELPMYRAENTHPAIVCKEIFDQAQRCAESETPSLREATRKLWCLTMIIPMRCARHLSKRISG